MSAVATIKRVLGTGILLADLVILPDRGATDADIAHEEATLPRPFSEQHKDLLRHWNGIGLEVIQFLGCGGATGEIERIADSQLDLGLVDAIAIASDPSGFLYLEAQDGRISSFDCDGGAIKELASNLDDFVERLVFGPDAAEFAGEDWLSELKENGLV